MSRFAGFNPFELLREAIDKYECDSAFAIETAIRKIITERGGSADNESYEKRIHNMLYRIRKAASKGNLFKYGFNVHYKAKGDRQIYQIVYDGVKPWKDEESSREREDSNAGWVVMESTHIQQTKNMIAMLNEALKYQEHDPIERKRLLQKLRVWNVVLDNLELSRDFG